MKNTKLSLYYVASVKRNECWLLSTVMRGTEHVAFDRCIDKVNSIFEFFVPEATESIFLEAMDYLQKKGVVYHYEKRDNRLLFETKL